MSVSLAAVLKNINLPESNTKEPARHPMRTLLKSGGGTSTTTYTTPTYTTPTYTPPTYSNPTYTTPTYITPTYSNPTYTTPTYPSNNNNDNDYDLFGGMGVFSGSSSSSAQSLTCNSRDKGRYYTDGANSADRADCQNMNSMICVVQLNLHQRCVEQEGVRQEVGDSRAALDKVAEQCDSIMVRVIGETLHLNYKGICVTGIQPYSGVPLSCPTVYLERPGTYNNVAYRDNCLSSTRTYEYNKGRDNHLDYHRQNMETLSCISLKEFNFNCQKSGNVNRTDLDCQSRSRDVQNVFISVFSDFHPGSRLDQSVFSRDCQPSHIISLSGVSQNAPGATTIVVTAATIIYLAEPLFSLVQRGFKSVQKNLFG